MYLLRFLPLFYVFVVIGGCSDSSRDMHATDVVATPAASASVVVENAYIKAPAPGQNVIAAYLTLHNRSDKSVMLNYVHSDLAEYVEVHRTFYQNGQMMMRPVAHLKLAAGETLIFKSGAYHFMLHGVVESLSVGDRFPLVLEFSGQPAVIVNLDVRSY